jgi:hypothetical protein
MTAFICLVVRYRKIEASFFYQNVPNPVAFRTREEISVAFCVI